MEPERGGDDPDSEVDPVAALPAVELVRVRLRTRVGPVPAAATRVVDVELVAELLAEAVPFDSPAPSGPWLGLTTMKIEVALAR